MTIEELQAELEKERASKAAVDQKNKELLAEKKKAVEAAETAREAAEAAAEEKARNEKDVATLEASLTKKYEKQIAQLTTDLQGKDAALTKLVIDNEITKTMVEGNVPAHFHEPLAAMFKSGAKLDGVEAKFGDASLTDHIKSYLTSDLGKNFVVAPVNSGGGAPGSKAISSAMTKENFNETRFAEWHAKEPSEATSWAKSNGFSYLVD